MLSLNNIGKCDMAINLDSDVLLVIDMQNDFCEGGSLAVKGADEIVPLINQLSKQFKHVVLTQDWHPIGHCSFELWPEHCIQGTKGADFHPNLSIPHAELIIRKGTRIDLDSYSAFYENDEITPTGLRSYLKEKGITRVFIVGLAFDYCVRFTAMDSMMCGFDTFIIEDACRAVHYENTYSHFYTHGSTRINSVDIDEKV